MCGLRLGSRAGDVLRRYNDARPRAIWTGAAAAVAKANAFDLRPSSGGGASRRHIMQAPRQNQCVADGPRSAAGPIFAPTRSVCTPQGLLL